MPSCNGECKVHAFVKGRRFYSPDSYFCKTCDGWFWRRNLVNNVFCGCCKQRVRFAPRGVCSFQRKDMVVRMDEAVIPQIPTTV